MSESQLENITKMIKASDIFGIKEVKPIGDDLPSYSIELNNGYTLNGLMPKGVRFLVDKDEPWYSPRQNVVHFNPELLNDQNYKAIFAHECGHSLIKNPKKANLAYLDTGHEILHDRLFKTLPLEYRVEKVYMLMQLELENELDAINRGKIVADLLGVDPIVYEDMATISLQTHYSFTLMTTLEIFKRSCPDIQDDTIIRYYNPFAQEATETTFCEFKKLSMEAKEDNKKAVNELKRRVTL